MNINSSFSHRSKEPESGVLYIVGTPIGNLNDITLRAINILKNCSIILCEDTRTTKKLLNKLEISNNLISLNDHNTKSRLSFVFSELSKGKSLALVSESGTPLISDPGEILVKELRNKNYDVISIPGPCAPISALVSSGFPCSKFVFYGFIPKFSKERKSILCSINKNKFPSIVFESPLRVVKLLSDLKSICGEERKIIVSRELTKKFEQHIGNNMIEVLNYFEKTPPKGEFTIVIGGNECVDKQNDQYLESIREEMLELINIGLTHSVAANYLSRKHKKPKNKIYNLIFDNNNKKKPFLSEVNE